jgi:hypothetical protein
MIERRRDRRRGAASWGVEQVTLRPGTHVDVVDLSPAGVQIETGRQLRPGARVHVRIVMERCAVSIAAHVLRCTVSAIHPEQGVTYRGALRFDERCQQFADPVMPASNARPPRA